MYDIYAFLIREVIGLLCRTFAAVRLRVLPYSDWLTLKTLVIRLLRLAGRKSWFWLNPVALCYHLINYLTGQLQVRARI